MHSKKLSFYGPVLGKLAQNASTLPTRTIAYWNCEMKFTKNIGMLLLAIFLILTGLFILIPSLAFSGHQNLMAILAIAAGVCILIGR
jgi:hypothetical protein